MALCSQVLCAGSAAYFQSPTFNEPSHLAAAVSVYELCSFGVYRVNPPLVRMLAGGPLLIAGVEVDWTSFTSAIRSRPEQRLGEDFIAANRERSFWLLTLARWACIPFSLLGAYFCFRWAGELYGPSAGLIALVLWCFCPNILGHGALITCDVAATSLGLAACYTFWLWLKEPTWTRTLTSGLVLGIAELAKMTLVVFVAVWPVMWLVYRWPDRKALGRRGWLRELAMIVVRFSIAVYVLNLGYAFEGTGTQLRDFRFVSQSLGGPAAAESPAGANRFADTWLGVLPVPLPKNYVQGIDLQKRDFEDYHQPSYLRGQFSPSGWWYYYLYALAIKVPLGTWVLVGMAASCGLWGKRHPAQEEGDSLILLRKIGTVPGRTLRDEFVLLCPAVVILAFVSSQTGFSQHMRYVLPAFPFVFIWIGRLAGTFDRRHWAAATVAGAALAWSIVSSLSVYPHSLSYFNELAGGPKHGPEHLIHSNVDWGQDLLNLKRWLEEHPEARPLRLAYFGGFDPIHLGIEYTAPAALPPGDSNYRPDPGWYAISVNFVRGFPYTIFTGDGSRRTLRQDELSYFQKLEPVAMAGYSIYIYHVTE